MSQILARRKDTLIDDWIKQLTINPNQSRISRFSNKSLICIIRCLKKLIGTIKSIHQIHPSTYEEFLSILGVGPSTNRTVSLIAELIFGLNTSWKNNVKFIFAHGRKGGVSFFMEKKNYDESIGFEVIN